VFDLYFITEASPSATVLSNLAAAVSGMPAPATASNKRGRLCVQLRAKHLTVREQHALATQAVTLCRARGVPLLINDRVDIALSVGADGVHLPEAGLPIAVARKLLGNRAWIGVSCHDAQGLARAAAEGADFATLSPVFASPGKGTPLGMPAFCALVSAAQLPVYALGGLTPECAQQLRTSGCRGLAAISAISRAADPAAAVQQFLSAWDRSPAT
jgi:thiamine-phosphate pyrophosphorylase